MIANTFQDVSGRYAAIVGRKDNVQVTFGGNNAFTDGSRLINLPAMPAGTTLTPQQTRVYSGYLDHESAHLRFTDMKVLDLDWEKRPLESQLRNVIEDVRVENKFIEYYPGARPDLDETHKFMDEKSRQKVESDKNLAGNYAQQVLGLIYKEAYKYRDHKVEGVKGELSDHPELVPIAEYMARWMPEMKSTASAVAVATGIQNLLPKNVDYSQQETEGGEQPKTTDGMAIKSGLGSLGDGKPLTKKEMEALFDKVLNGKGLEQSDLDGKKLTPSDKAILEGIILTRIFSDLKNAFDDVTKDIKAKNEKELREVKDPSLEEERKPKSRFMKGNGEGSQVLPPETTQYDKIFVPSAVNLPRYKSERAAMSTEILQTRRMLNIFLQSRARKAKSRGMEEGKLDTSQLASMYTGNTHLYYENRDKVMMDTDIGLMLDLSGSMDSSIIRRSGILLSESIQGIQKTKLMIAGFTTGYGRSLYSLRRTNQLKGVGRTDPLIISLFKGFDEPYNKVQGRLGAIESSSATPLGEGYAYGFEAMVHRKARKRVLWIVSDGEPALSLGDNSHSEYLLMKQMQLKCKAYGIITVGLGIGKNRRLRKYVDKYAEISDCSEMPQAVLTIMKEIATWQ